MSTRSDHWKFSSVRKNSVAAVDLVRGLRFIIQCCFCFCLLRKLFSHIYVYLVCIASVLECFCHRCIGNKNRALITIACTSPLSFVWKIVLITAV